MKKFFKVFSLLFISFIFIAVFILPTVPYHPNWIKVDSHYQEAIRQARNVYLKSSAQEGVIPEDATGWVLLFNPDGNLAPGGGNAYLADDIDGDATTGAIGVVSNSRESVIIAKPAYDDLAAETTTVTAAFTFREKDNSEFYLSRH